MFCMGMALGAWGLWTAQAFFTVRNQSRTMR